MAKKRTAKKTRTQAMARKRSRPEWPEQDDGEDTGEGDQAPVRRPLLAGDDMNPLAVAIDAVTQWRDADRRYAVGFVRAHDGDAILRHIAGATAMLAAAALRAHRLAEAGLYVTFAEEI